MPGGSFDEIVDHREHHQCIPPLRPVNRNTAQIHAAHRTRVWMRASRQYIHERFCGKTSLKEPLVIRLAGNARIQRGVYAANHRHQMRHEGQTYLASGDGFKALHRLR